MESLTPAFGLLLALLIPIVAVIGGIVHGIVRTIGRQRLAELAQRERIIALERGLNPQDLPPFMPAGLSRSECESQSFRHAQISRRQGLRVGGIIVLFLGIGIGLPLVVLGYKAGWIPGILLVMIGVSLLIGSSVISENGNGHRSAGQGE